MDTLVIVVVVLILLFLIAALTLAVQSSHPAKPLLEDEIRAIGEETIRKRKQLSNDFKEEVCNYLKTRRDQGDFPD